MARRFKCSALSGAIAASLMCGSLALAQCDSGGCDSGGIVGGYHAQPQAVTYAPSPVSYAHGQVGGGCASGNCSFGYPGGGGCASGTCGGGRGFGGNHGHPIREHANHLMQIHRRDYARNQAWPKPFDCADRQLYFQIFEPMLETGYRANCLFTALHFDVETNMLNEVGRAKLAGIFKNNPVGQKVALVQTDGNAGVLDARLQNLQSTVDKWYGNESFSQIAFSGEFPSRFAGSRVESLNRMSLEETAAPILPVATGSGSTSDIGVGE